MGKIKLTEISTRAPKDMDKDKIKQKGSKKINDLYIFNEISRDSEPLDKLGHIL